MPALMLLLSLIVVVIPEYAKAQISARRAPGESFEAARDRSYLAKAITPAGDSAQSVAVAIERLNRLAAPEWNSLSEIERAFEEARDAQILRWDDAPNFPRRITWLYPDDGCFARAAQVHQFLEKPTASLFVFGTLTVATDNHPRGYVRWWYHVVPVARVGTQLYAIDPAIDPSGPLSLEDWADLQRTRATPAQKFSICSSNTVSPASSCNASVPHIPNIQKYLGYEWSRQLALGRNPDDILGPNPPW